MKNIKKELVGKYEYWRVEFMRNGSRIVKRFKSYNDALLYRKNRLNLEVSAIPEIIDLSAMEIEDAKKAFQALPKGVSLEECVKFYIENQIVPKGINEAFHEWLLTKKGVSSDYLRILKARVGNLIEFVGNFKNASPEKILEFVQKQKAPKTQKHYFATIKEFFAFCEQRQYWQNPFRKITKSEAPKVKRKKIEIPTPESWQEVFIDIERECPNIAGLYALVGFGGIRLAEAQRLELSEIDFARREIILSFDKTKTGDSWLQSHMPANVWDWLQKYPPNSYWRYAHPERLIKASTKIKLPNNAFRHSFACYHLSLYRDAQKTSILLRHRSPNTMWQNYIDTLTSKDVAEKYFAIVPKK